MNTDSRGENRASRRGHSSQCGATDSGTDAIRDCQKVVRILKLNTEA
jgi:hypothetical protein